MSLGPLSQLVWVKFNVPWSEREGKEREGGEGIAGAEECVLGPYK